MRSIARVLMNVVRRLPRAVYVQQIAVALHPHERGIRITGVVSLGTTDLADVGPIILDLSECGCEVLTVGSPVVRVARTGRGHRYTVSLRSASDTWEHSTVGIELLWRRNDISALAPPVISLDPVAAGWEVGKGGAHPSWDVGFDEDVEGIDLAGVDGARGEPASSGHLVTAVLVSDGLRVDRDRSRLGITATRSCRTAYGSTIDRIAEAIVESFERVGGVAGMAPATRVVLGTSSDVDGNLHASAAFLPLDVIVGTATDRLEARVLGKITYWLSRIWWGAGVSLHGPRAVDVQLGLIGAMAFLAEADRTEFIPSALLKASSIRRPAALSLAIREAWVRDPQLVEVLRSVMAVNWGRSIPAKLVLQELARAGVKIPSRI